MSQLKAIRDEIVTALKTATLAGINDVTPKRVYRRRFPWYRDDLPLPCCVVCFLPERFKDVVNNKNDIAYCFQITFMKALAAPELNDEADASEPVMLWREAAMDLFRAGRIPAGTLAHLCKIEPGPPLDETSHRNKVDATSFVLVCWRRR